MTRAHLPPALAAIACVGAVFGCTYDPCGSGRCIDLDALPPLTDAGTQVTSADAACAMQSARAVRGSDQPLDVVFVIDNSGSMTEEIAAVRENINRNFATLIQASGADYRVIVLSKYGADATTVCIEPPLAGADCELGLLETNSAVFFHYNLEIDSYNGLCQLLYALDLPDPEGRAPAGLSTWLRPAAQKAIIVITDDSAACRYVDGAIDLLIGEREGDPYSDALAFHRALSAKAPELFGSGSDSRYRFFGFVGMAESAHLGEPYFPHESLVESSCDTATSPGLSYQALSVITDALRYPVCEGRGFDAVFRVLAQSVVESTKADCVFEIPEAPPGQSINRASIAIEYRPAGGAPIAIDQVAGRDDCGAHSFYVTGDQLQLCPASCAEVEADRLAELRVLYGCSIVPE